MTKIEMLAAYLPYGVHAVTDDSKTGEIVGITKKNAQTQSNPIRVSIKSKRYPDVIRDSFFDYDEVKLLLRPISEVEQAKTKLFSNLEDKKMQVWWMDTEQKLLSGNFDLVESGIIKDLNKLHFDTGNFIEKGWAVAK